MNSCVEGTGETEAYRTRVCFVNNVLRNPLEKMRWSTFFWCKFALVEELHCWLRKKRKSIRDRNIDMRKRKKAINEEKKSINKMKRKDERKQKKV